MKIDGLGYIRLVSAVGFFLVGAGWAEQKQYDRAALFALTAAVLFHGVEDRARG